MKSFLLLKHYSPQIDDVNLSNSFVKDQTMDTETENLITAIENLTSRALKETGQQWESMESNILQPIKTKLTSNQVEDDNELYVGSKKTFDSQTFISDNKEKSNKSNNATSSCESSSCSSSSFIAESSEVKMKEGIGIERTLEYSQTNKTDNKSFPNTDGVNDAHVIDNIKYTKNHIKLESQHFDDNNCKNEAHSDNYSICNNNKNAETKN